MTKNQRFPTQPRFVIATLRGVVLATVIGLTGCVSIPPEQRDPADPAESYNRGAYGFNEGLDEAALKPVATAYSETFADGIRRAISNFFDNITYLDTVLNSFLQGKVKQGFSDLTRFTVNSTLGIGGLFDVATAGGVPRNDEDFGQTLAVWGAGDGAYLVYPVFGPSSVRDTGGLLVSLATNPIMYAAAPVAIPLSILGIVDLRARNEGFAQFRDTAALDPYVFTRESYLQYRVAQVYDGNPPRRSLLDEEAEDAATPDASSALETEGPSLHAYEYREPERSDRIIAPEIVFDSVA